ncbi:YDG domain-containing protein [Spiribacter sp. 221]|uniref:YDG domain-containing protein n=1 Tax=Spiribacter onubensis TaxID=3122420 RepID=UPI00349F55A6
MAPTALVAQPLADQLPEGGTVTHGSAAMERTPGALTIRQGSERLITEWQEFSIGRDARVEFIQPSADSAALNRVVGVRPSEIHGSLTANGEVLIINPAGIHFASGSTIDVGALTASTLNLSDADFLAGNRRFAGTGAGAITAEGEIKIGRDGWLTFVAPLIEHRGNITAPSGQVSMAAGEAVELALDADGLVSLKVTQGAIDAAIENGGAIEVGDGAVLLNARGMDELTRAVVNNTGYIEADGLDTDGGRIRLTSSGDVNNSGTLSADSRDGAGGRIVVEGDAITLGEDSVATATGAASGGDILVGGDWQGGANDQRRVFEDPDAVREATTVTMDSGARIDASATGNGDGGTVVLWSDVTHPDSLTSVHGEIFARGGPQRGDGGLVETSGYSLNAESGRVDAGADEGAGGLWLIDPDDITIDQSTADGYASALDSGTSVEVLAEDGKIDWDGATLEKTAGGDATLTLRTSSTDTITKSISFNGGSISSSSGALNVVAWTDSGASGSGTATVNLDGVSIDTNGGHFWIGAGAEETWNGIQGGSGRAFTYNPDSSGVEIVNSSITTDGGDVRVKGLAHHTSGGDVGRNNGVRVHQNSSIHTTSGSIDIDGLLKGNYDTGVGLHIGGDGTLSDDTTKLSTTTGNISLKGVDEGVAGWGHGLLLRANGNNTITRVRTTAGAINIDGNTATNNTNDGSGVQLQSSGLLAVVSQSGDITITGAASSADSGNFINGIRLAAENTSNRIQIGFDGTTTYSGNIKLISDSILQRNVNAGAGSLSLQTTGSLIIEPKGNAFTHLRAGSGTLTFDDDWNFGTTLSALTIGKSTNTFDITLSNAIETAGSVSIYGGQIDVQPTLTAAGDILIRAGGNNDVLFGGAITNTSTSNASTTTIEAGRHVRLGANATVSATQAAIDTQLWADTNADGDGIIYVESESVGTNGGSLTFGKQGQTANIAGSTVLVGGDTFFQRSASAQSLTTEGGALDIYGETIVANTNGLTFDTTDASGSGSDGAVVLHGLLNSGNSYSFTSTTDNYPWTNARADAKGATSGGSAVGDSYLVTITSRLENSIAGLTADYQSSWIGAFRDKDNSIGNGDNQWYWADGPEADVNFFTQSAGGGGTAVDGYFEFFAGGEPNGTGTGGESYGQFFGAEGRWNDLGNFGSTNPTYTLKGYVVETNADASPVTIDAGTGAVTIGGGIGTSKALASLDVTAADTAVNGNGIVTTGAQTYSSGLTVNSAGSTTGVRLEAGSGGMDVEGPVEVYGGNINVAGSLDTSSVSGADGDVLLKSAGDISLAAGKSIDTSGGNVVLWANSDDQSTDGSIALRNGSSITTGSNSVAGGVVWLGGGADGGTWEGVTVGQGYAVPGTEFTPSNSGGNIITGVYLERNSISSFGGGIKIAGDASSRSSGGIVTYGNTVDIDAGSGVVEIIGAASDTSDDPRGILFGIHDNTIASTVNILSSSSGDAITLTGTGQGDADAIAMSGTLNIISSGGGTILLSGDAQGTGGGIVAGNFYNGILNVHADSGSITLDGGSNGVAVKKRVMDGKTSGPSKINIGQGGPITSSSSDVFIIGDAITLDPTEDGIEVDSSGAFTIAPSSASFANPMSYPITDLTVGSSVSGLTIGKESNTANITIGGALDIAGPIAVYGGAVTLASNLTSQATTGTGVTVAGSGITQNAGVDVVTNGADIDFTVANTVSTNGRDNFLLLDGSDGNRATLDAQGGNITFSSTVSANGSHDPGSSLDSDRAGNFIYSTFRTSGDGTISITGDASLSPTEGNVFALQLGEVVLETDTGAITVTGIGGGNSANSRGIAVDGSSLQVLSTSGAITLRDEKPSNLASGADYTGFYLEPISAGAIVIGAASGTGMTSSSSAISIEADKATFAGNATEFDTTGSFSLTSAVEPTFLAGVNTTNVNLTGNPSSITLGKTTNTADVTVGSALTAAGPISVYGGDLTLNDAVTATNSTLTLNASGSVTQSAALTADNLSLGGVGDFTLTNAANNVAILAGGSSTTPLGSLSYVDADALTIGMVNPTGLWSAGDVAVSTVSGDLTLAESIQTTAGTASAIVLNAGSGEDISSAAPAVGTDTAGNLLVSNGATVVTGSGGRVTLYTGSLADSTGVAESHPSADDNGHWLVDDGSGRFRYGSDETTTRYSATLGTGVFAIYREQPQLTVKPDGETITYGENPGLTTGVSDTANLANGDTVAAAYGADLAANVYDAADTNPVTPNTSGYYDATAGGSPYTLRVGDGSVPSTSALGYELSTATDTLTVNQRAATVTANDDAKFYSQTDPSGFAGISYTGLASGETDLGGTASVNRASGEAVGDYALTPSITSPSANYTVTYVGGTFTILPVDHLRVQVGSTSTDYGTEASYTATSASYITAPNSVTSNAAASALSGGDTVTLTDGSSNLATAEVVAIDGDVLEIGNVTYESGVSSFADATKVSASGTDYSVTATNVLEEIDLTLTDATGSATDDLVFTDANDATVTLNIDGDGTRNTTTGQWDVGSYSLLAENVVNVTGALASGIAIAGQLEVNPKTVSLSANRTYDGTRELGSADLTLDTGVTSDAGKETLTFNNAFANDRDVAEASHVSSIVLQDATDGSGGRASNYQLPDLSASGANNQVTLTRRPLSLSATRVYDGTDDVAAALSLRAISGNPDSGLVEGESLEVSAATASDLHVATPDKFVSSVTLADASGRVGNYSIQGQNPTAGSALSTGLSHTTAENEVSFSARPLSVTLTNTGVTKVYDGTTDADVADGNNANTPFTPSYAISGLASTDSNPGFTYTGSYNTKDVTTADTLSLASFALDSISGAGNTSDYTVPSSVSVAASITPRPLEISGSGVSKVYDGTTAMDNVTVGFAGTGAAESGLVSGETITVSGGTGAFDSADVGTGKAYSLTGFSLSEGGGADPDNYSIPGGGTTTITGNDGTITQRPLVITFTGDDRAYDGSAAATVSLAYTGTDSQKPVVGDDLVVDRSAAFADKNVGTNRTVSISGVGLSGEAAGNYSVTITGASFNTTTTASIMRLDSATWTGSGDGSHWFDPANWESTTGGLAGTVPDLANVAAVVVPEGTAITLDEGSLSGAAEAGTVELTSLTYGDDTGARDTGALDLVDGTLEVAGDATLGALTSAVGTTLSAAGTLSVDVSAGDTDTVAGFLGGSGGLAKEGDGTLVLSGTNTYAGTTALNDGILKVTGTLADATALTVASGAEYAVDSTDTIGSLAGAGTVTIASSTVLSSGADNSSTTFSGGIGGDGALTKQGTGTLTLSGQQTYTGDTTVDGGTLRVTGNLGGSSWDYAGAIALASGATLEYAETGSTQTLSGVITGAGGLSMTANGGKLALTSGSSTFAGGIAVTAGRVEAGASSTGSVTSGPFGTGTVSASGGGAIDLNGQTIANALSLASVGQTLNDRALYNASGNAATASGPITLTGDTVIDASSGDLTISGVVSGDANADLLKTGSGKLVLTGNNTYEGVTTVGAGTLEARDSNATPTPLGAPSAGTVVSSGATLDLAPPSGYTGIYSVGEPVTLDGGTLAKGGSTARITGAISLTDDSVIHVASDEFTLAGVISGDYGISKMGAGTALLTGVNTYMGATAINAGTLGIFGSSNLGTTPTSVAPAHLMLNGGTLSALNDLTLSANRGITIGSANGTLEVDAGKTLSISSIVAGAGNLTKRGPGDLGLFGANTYSGNTTIADGNLSIDGSGSLGNGNYAGTISIADGSELRYTSILSQELSGVISGDGAIKTEASATALTLSAPNTFAGGVEVTAGIVKAGVDSALSGGSLDSGAVGIGTVTVTSGGALDLNAKSVANNLSLAGTGDTNSGALFNSASGGSNTTGAITLTGDTTVKANNGTITLGSAIDGGHALTLDHTAQVTLDEAVGGTTALTSLSSNGLLAVEKNIKTDGNTQTYDGVTTFADGITLTALSGDISGTGPISAQSVTLDAQAGSVLFTNTANEFTGTVTIPNATNATLVDATGLDLGASTVVGDLALTTGSGGATGGLTQSGALTVGGTSTFTADGLANQDASLSGQDNRFGGAVTFAGANGGSWNGVALKETDGGIVLGATDVSGNFSLESTDGAITQSTGTTVGIGGTTTLTASNGAPTPTFYDITLAESGNDFGAEVRVISADNVRLADTNALTVHDLTASGNLLLSAGGNLVAEDGSGSGTDSLQAGGNLRLASSGGALDLQTDVTSTGGDITFLADTNIDLASGVTVTTGAGQTFYGEATSGAWTMAADTSVVTGDSASDPVTTGDIYVKTGSDLTVSSLDADGGTIYLEAGGSLLDADASGSSSPSQLQASGLALVAGGSIGSSSGSGALETTAGTLAATAAGADGIDLRGEGGTLTVDSVESPTDTRYSAVVEQVTVTGTTATVEKASLSDVRTTANNGKIDLRTPNGALTINGGSDGSSSVGVSAHGSGAIALKATGSTGTRTLTVNADVLSGSGLFDLYAEEALTVGAGVSLTTGTGGVVRVESGAAGLGLGAGSTVSSGTGNVSLVAETGVTVGAGSSVTTSGNGLLFVAGKTAVTVDDNSTLTGGTGGLLVRAGQDLSVGSGSALSAESTGLVLLEAETGNLTISGTAADTTTTVSSGTGDITLTAADTLHLETDPSANGAVTVSTGGSGSLTLFATGADLLMDATASLQTADGDQILEAKGDGGDGSTVRLVVGDLTATNGKVSLTSAGSIEDADTPTETDDADTDVSAQALRIDADTFAGKQANQLETAVGTLAAITGSASDGRLYVRETDALTVGTTGSIATEKVVVSGGALATETETVTGLSGIDAEGPLELTAGGTVTQAANIETLGNLSVETTAGGISMENDATATAGDGGSVLYTASGAISLGGIVTGPADGGVTTSPGITVEAGTTIADNRTAGSTLPVNFSSVGPVDLQANQGIGTRSDPLTLRSGTLSVANDGTGAAGGIYLTEVAGTGGTSNELRVTGWDQQAATGDSVLSTEKGAISFSGPVTHQAGALTVTANEGAIAQTDDAGTMTVASGPATFMAVGQDIELDLASNDFGGSVTASGANISITNRNALQLGAITATGDFTTRTGAPKGSTSSGLTQAPATETAILAIDGDATFLAIGVADQSANLRTQANEFGGKVSFLDDPNPKSGGSWGTIGVKKEGDAVLGDLSATGDYAVLVTGTLTNDPNATITIAGNAEFEGASITLGDQIGDNLSFGTLTFMSSGDVSIAEDDAMEIANFPDDDPSAAANLTLSAAGPITDGTGGQLEVTGTASLTANNGTSDDAITLDNNEHDFGGAVAATGSDITLTDRNALALGTLNASGNLVTKTGSGGAGGGLTQSGIVTVTGTSTFTADTSTDQDAVLANVDNDFGGVVTFDNANAGSWRDLTIVDKNDLTLGDVTASGKLDATAADDLDLSGTITADSADLTSTGGAITQSGGTLTVVTGPTNLEADGAITLDRENDFNGTVNVLGGTDVTLNDTDDLTLGDVTASGKLDATAATDLNLNGTIAVDQLTAAATSGAITQGPDGQLTVLTGPTDLTAGTDITLDAPTNDFNGTVNADGQNITLADGTGGLTLGDVTATGTLDATSTDGPIDQAAGTGIRVDGNTSITARSGSNPPSDFDITLNGADNSFGANVSARGRDVTLAASSGLRVDVLASGDLSPRSGGTTLLENIVVGGDMSIVSRDDILTVGEVVVFGVTDATSVNGRVVGVGEPYYRSLVPQDQLPGAGRSVSGSSASASGRTMIIRGTDVVIVRTAVNMPLADGAGQSAVPIAVFRVSEGGIPDALPTLSLSMDNGDLVLRSAGVRVDAGAEPVPERFLERVTFETQDVDGRRGRFEAMLAEGGRVVIRGVDAVGSRLLEGDVKSVVGVALAELQAQRGVPSMSVTAVFLVQPTGVVMAGR